MIPGAHGRESLRVVAMVPVANNVNIKSTLGQSNSIARHCNCWSTIFLSILSSNPAGICVCDWTIPMLADVNVPFFVRCAHSATSHNEQVIQL
jgi:hypothetical protein